MSAARFYLKLSDGSIAPLLDAEIDAVPERIVSYLDGHDITDLQRHLSLGVRNETSVSLYVRMRELIIRLLPEPPCTEVTSIVRFTPGVRSAVGRLPPGSQRYVVSCDYALSRRPDGVECVTGARMSACTITDAELRALRQALP